jgi:hypothetical protein
MPRTTRPPTQPNITTAKQRSTYDSARHRAPTLILLDVIVVAVVQVMADAPRMERHQKHAVAQVAAHVVHPHTV